MVIDVKNVARIAAAYQMQAAYSSVRQEHRRRWRLAERYWASDQWPSNISSIYPRPVMNITWEDVERKIAVLVSHDPLLHYAPRAANVDPARGALLDQRAAVFWDEERVLQKYEALGRTAALMGSGHWLVTPEVLPQGNAARGDLRTTRVRLTEIDPEAYYYGDETEPDIQNQPWIIITELLPIDTLRDQDRESAQAIGVNVDDIVPVSIAASAEQPLYTQERDLVLARDRVFVINLFWKDKRGVNYARVAGGKPTRFQTGIFTHGLYPLLKFDWYPRRRSAVGLSEFDLLYPNQETINRTVAFLTYAAQVSGVPQRVAKFGALGDNQKWTADGTQMLVDMLQGNEHGFYYLQPPQLNQMLLALPDSLMDWVRRQSGLLDAVTGATPAGGLNATAIAFLQQAAAVLTRTFVNHGHRMLEQLGDMLLAYYTEPDLFTTSERLVAPMPEGDVEFTFRGSDFTNERWAAKVVVGAGAFWDEQTQVQALDNLLAHDKIDIEAYLHVVPQRVLPQAPKLLEFVRQQKAQGAVPGAAGGNVTMLPGAVTARLGAAQGATPGPILQGQEKRPQLSVVGGGSG